MSQFKWKLSASLIMALKACPMRCYIQYILGYRPIEDTDALRMGTNWHAIQEINGLPPGGPCPNCVPKGAKEAKPDPDCILCHGTLKLPDNIMDAVIAVLNKAYTERPISKSADEWETERIKLLYSLVGYNWYYQNSLQEYEILAQEIKFSIPFLSPASNKRLHGVELTGRIDKILRNKQTGKTFIKEHKSTSSKIEPDSDYWSHLNLDTQTRLYPYALRQFPIDGQYYKDAGVLFDVWHKPQISPKKLLYADVDTLIETGEYCGQKFEVERKWGGTHEKPTQLIGNWPAEVFPGKSSKFTIRETPAMYGARLLQDICAEPTKYFAQREVPRTEDDINAFGVELYHIYKMLRVFKNTGHWWRNEQQCEATFKCPYISLCYNNITPDERKVPEGLKCIYDKGKK